MFNLSSLLGSGMVSLVMYSAAIAAVGGFIYIWHYKPINVLNESKDVYELKINQQVNIIENLNLEIVNSQALLLKCKEDQKAKEFETEFGTRGQTLDNLAEKINKREGKDQNESTSNDIGNLRIIF